MSQFINDKKELLAQRIADVRQQMAQAAQLAGRKPEEIALCAACKAQDSALIALSASLPIDCFGENRAQELSTNLQAAAYQGKPVHFIGHLQTNKVRQVVGQVALIQSVGSQRLLNAIAREAQRQGLVQDILLQINLGEEDSKSGVLALELPALLEAALALPAVQVQGLMAIPPLSLNQDENRRYFAQLRSLIEQARRHTALPLPTLSMGMTGSFEAAILEGATLIRVGRQIFGERN